VVAGCGWHVKGRFCGEGRGRRCTPYSSRRKALGGHPTCQLAAQAQPALPLSSACRLTRQATGQPTVACLAQGSDSWRIEAASLK